MGLANRSKHWPTFDPPAHRGSVTVADVLHAVPGSERDAAILRWAAAVWTAWEGAHPAVRTLIGRYEERPRPTRAIRRDRIASKRRPGHS
jgi:hypothetical protein